MEALDGNAIGGLLREVFGVEMTIATGTCAHCGATGYLAEFEVYLQAPGTVARCRTCRNVLMVLVTIRGITCVDVSGFTEFEPPLSGDRAVPR
jgi:Family of unknown function (DUF6510)